MHLPQGPQEEGDKDGPKKSKKITDKVSLKARNIELEGKLFERVQILIDNPGARELQKRAYGDFLESLKQYKKSGIFKMPTGSGKTQVYANMIQSLQKNGLVLIPRTDLYESNLKDFKAVGFTEEEILFPHEETGSNAAERFLAMLKNPKNDWKSGRMQCIMTYQSLVTMCKKKPEIGELIRQHFDVIIQDEAHRGLGDSTKAITTMISDEDQYIQDGEDLELESEEDEAEKIIGHLGERYEYKFTATPDLLAKSVTDDGEYIHYSTFEDAVRTGAIVLPQYASVGKAYLADSELVKWTTTDIENLSEHDAFVDEEAVLISDKIIDLYSEKKKKHGTLPSVAFAATIKHAEHIVEKLQKKGIKAARVTSDKSDISSSDATKLIDEGKLDVIVTVTKVSEGFDYPPLSCAMWFAPALSPAKILQGNGRITRDLDYKRPYSVLDEEGKLNPSPNTYIIAPEKWYGSKRREAGKPYEDDEDPGTTICGGPDDDELHPGGEGPGNEEDGEEPGIEGGTGKKKKQGPGIWNFYELLINQGEMDINSFGVGSRDLIDIGTSIVCEIGQEINIDGIVYIGVTHGNEVLGVKGNTILNNAKKQGETIIQAKQKNGSSIQLIRKEFIESLQAHYICEPGEEIDIDGIVYIGVTSTTAEILGVQGQRIIENAIKKNETIIQAKQKNGRSIRLIRKEFIASLNNNCEPGEEKEIDGIVRVGVTSTTAEILGVQGQRIIENAIKMNETIIHAKQKNGRSIKLIRKEFIESLQVHYTCESGQEIEINGIAFFGVINKDEILGVMGETIFRHAKKQGETIIQAKQKNGKNIRLIRKEFIESLVAKKNLPE